ncbi:MAG: galactose-1-phosphate uridylyltransferase [Pseudomonadota bacterium]
MSDQSNDVSTTLARHVGTQPVYRRSYAKSDGRKLHLYGYTQHTLPPLPGEQLEQVTGSELRFHPMRQTWSVYAAGRNKRTFKPNAAKDPLAPSKPGDPQTEIPFQDFELCVFDNRFPAFNPSSELAPTGIGEVDRRPAAGTCEVIVYAPDQTGSLASLGQARRRLILSAWIDRYERLYSDGHAYVLPFENRGDAVGVTLHHPHGQIYALPVIPQPQDAAQKAFEGGYDLAAHLPDWQDDYAIAEAGGIMAFAPPFARFPYEIWLAPMDPVSGPWAFTEDQADGFAHLLGLVTERYDAFFGTATPYMFSLQAAPHGQDGPFQFTAQFYPLLRAPNRIKYFASVEQVTGVFTVDIMPEDAAKALRNP